MYILCMHLYKYNSSIKRFKELYFNLFAYIKIKKISLKNTHIKYIKKYLIYILYYSSETWIIYKIDEQNILTNGTTVNL